MLSIDTDNKQTVVHIQTPCIHQDNLNDIKEAIAEMLYADECVYVDLQDIERIDSSGIALFVRLHKQAQDLNSKVIFINLTDQIASLLRTTNLDSILNIQEKRQRDSQNNDFSILIADDLPIICKAIEKSLRANNFSAISLAHNGADALLQAHQKKPNFIILDYYMPIINGGDCLPILRKNHPKSYICLMSTEDELIKIPPQDIQNADQIFYKQRSIGKDIVNMILEVTQ